MAHKKGVGSSRNGRDSQSQRRGINVARYAHDAGPVIGIRPAGKALGRVEHTLHALDEHDVADVCNFQQPLAAQQTIAGDPPDPGHLALG